MPCNLTDNIVPTGQHMTLKKTLLIDTMFDPALVRHKAQKG